MTMPLLKDESAAQPAPASVVADVVKLQPLRPSFFTAKLVPVLKNLAASVLPPLITLALILTIWQILCMKPGATLPSPMRIWADAKDLIVDPFFVAGPQDIGLGWRILTSLQRVAIGFGLAAVVGVLLGALVGQSLWAMRGLDPIFQVLRTVPPLAW